MGNDTITLIGKELEVINSKNKTLIGKKGKITMETRNTITLNDRTRLIKSHLIIKIGSSILKGESIIGTPENRLKKTWSKK